MPNFKIAKVLPFIGTGFFRLYPDFKKGTGRYLSLALRSDDEPVVSYYDEVDGGTAVVRFEGRELYDRELVVRLVSVLE